MFRKIKERVGLLISKAAEYTKEEAVLSLESSKFADLSSKIAFFVARNKGEKENPAKIAAQIVEKINKADKSDWIEKIEASGPYINFYFSDKLYLEIIHEIVTKKEDYGKSNKKKEKTLIEFPSVNPNKPWHAGHLRNALLGDSIARILEFNGYQIQKVDYIDDLGLQLAQSLWGFLHYDSDPKGKFDFWLGEQYVGVAKKFEEDKTVVEGIRETLKAMEEGDNEIAEAGRTLSEKCVVAQYETAFNFGIYHDVLVFESDIIKTIFEEGTEYLKSSSVVVYEAKGKNSGCWVVKLSSQEQFEEMKNPDKVLIRSDGTAVYTGKDVIFHLWKFGKLQRKFKYQKFIKQPNGKWVYKTAQLGQDMKFGGVEKVINVIGAAQKYPQQVVTEVLKKLGLEREALNLHHLAYEEVGLPEGQFSGRRGTWKGYTADELLDEAKRRVMEKIKVEANLEEKEIIASVVGVGAIKFSFLRIGPEKRIVFKWEEALNLEGDSGPYIQYAYVRTKGILNKTNERIDQAVDMGTTNNVNFNDGEKTLLKKLLQFSEIAEKSARELSPHSLTQYSLEVASLFSSFYTNSPVLNANREEIRKMRLTITLATSIVLKNSLALLGIDCVEKM